jgi:betaine-aldehyde dehydrogenase
MASATRALAALRSDAVFINGAWRKTLTSFPVVSPTTGAVHAQAPQGTAETVDEAVRAAATAFVSWAATPAATRAAHLRALADELEKRKEDVASVEAFNCGKPVREAYGDVDDACAAFRYCARQADNFDARYPQPVEPMPDTSMVASVSYEPVGVVAAICPFNFPLMMAAWKVGPSLAAGCTIVVKPSEFTPFSALCLADAALAAGIPPGVINVVTGGGDVGAALTAHALVNKVTFTGSVPTGAKVMAAAAPDIKRVTLELGGKSPAIVFADADIEKAIEWIFFGFAWNAGMICSATARLLVHESVAPALVTRLAAAAGRVKAAGPFDEGSELGPINNGMQFKKVMGYIAQAQAEGATLVCGGGPPAGLSPSYAAGFFVAPTIFTGVTPKHTIFREEVFGPVATVTTFSTEEEAIALANDSDFGLAAAIFTTDKAKGDRVAAAVRAGTVWINQAQPSPHALTWGGFKKSGIGREMGPLALLPFL